jgi:hypothetical protein
MVRVIGCFSSRRHRGVAHFGSFVEKWIENSLEVGNDERQFLCEIHLL